MVPNSAEGELKRSEQARKTRTKFHLLDHRENLAECPGCQAKVRNKPHYKGAFERSAEDHSTTVTMDQVSMTDVDGTMGVGGFRYAIVFAEVEHDYWRFKPLKGLGSRRSKEILQRVSQGHKGGLRRGARLLRRPQELD